MSRPGRPADKAAQQCLQLLHVLAAAAPRVVPTAELLEKAGYAGSLEAQQRNLRRHVDQLKQAGYAIRQEAPPGLPGGYRMAVQDHSLIAALTSDQRAALLETLVALRLGHVAGVLGEPSRAAVREPGGAVVQLQQPESLPEVHRALRDRRVLRFRYNGRDRVVQPVRLVVRAHEWQLDAYEPAAAKTKTFVLARMDRVFAGTEPAGYPPSADRATSGDPLTWQVDPPVRATVRVDTAHRGEVELALGTPVARAADGDGLLLEFDVTNNLVFRARLLALGGRALLLGPPQLRAALLDHLRAVAETG